MTGTTIKLDPRTRDRLRKQAGAAGRTLREHIEHLIVAEDRRLRMDALGAAVAATPADRMSEYSAETAVWESAELTDARRA
jgi:c-di-AMP phosphodiesterase-like protein